LGLTKSQNLEKISASKKEDDYCECLYRLMLLDTKYFEERESIYTGSKRKEGDYDQYTGY